MPHLHNLKTQANAVHGFRMWLTSTLPRQTEESREFSDHLLHVLDVHGRELDRQIDNEAATQNWFSLISTTSILALMLHDELLEVNPALKSYRPTDEPQTIHEMIVRLLSDAMTLFEQSQSDMATYLEKPVVPGKARGS